MLGPPDVGQRVVIRRIVGVREGRPLYSDVLGFLAAAGARDLLLEADSGVVLRVPVAAVVAAKRVPPRRVAAPGQVAALERAAGDAWPAPHTGRLGGWRLRAAGGWTGRANSALAVGDPGRPLPAAVDEVTRWYARRGLPARIAVPEPLAAPVARYLAGAGWTAAPEVLVQTVPLADLPPVLPAPRVDLDRYPTPAALALVAAQKGALPPAAYPVLYGPACVRFATVPDPAGGLLGICRGAVTRRRLHLGLMQVAPAHRGRGLATALLLALAGWAAGVGAHTGYLQVQHDNTAAVRLYRRLGFTTSHTYRCWTAP